MKKSSMIILSVILVTGLFASCTGGKEKTPSERIIGTWEIVEASGAFSDSNVGMIYTFGKEGAFSQKNKYLETKGKVTKIDDESFTIKFDDLPDADFIYTYKFENETIKIELVSSDQVFTLERK